MTKTGRPRHSRTASHLALISVAYSTAAAAVLLAAGSALAQGPSFRTIDGLANNAAHPIWGSAGSDYLRESSGAHYADGLSIPAGSSRPSARLVSNLVAAQGPIETADERSLATAVYEFGQFLDHDIGLADTGITEIMNISVPSGDAWFDPGATGLQSIGFTRSVYDLTTGLTSPRQQVNTITSFIDASQVYGSDPVRAAWLRSFTGGHLKVVSTSYGDSLPFNDGTLSNADPVGLPATSLHVSGDVRTNEQPGLTVLHTVFLREHNLQADRFHAAHSTWDDERLYQEARRWVGAEMQVIVYNEFLPALLGQPLPPYTGYRDYIDPGLSNAFATAGYRMGHSMVGPDIDILDHNFQPTGVIVDLADAFFNPAVIPAVGGVEPIVRYMVSNTEQKTDTKIVDPLRNFLFGPPGAGGFDLAALNIQRGRDHGLADYNTMREDFGLARVTTFSQITSDPDLALSLQSLYTTVDNIDPWVGLLAEDHLPGSSLGPTHSAILIDQFTRMRDGDRFWYQNLALDPADLAALDSARLSDIFRRTTTVTGIQDNVFFARVPTCGSADFNADGDLGTDADIEAFFACLAGSCCPTCGSADFNADGDIGTDGDIEAFFHVLSGGTC